MLDKKPIKVAITGAAGNIGANLAFRIAAGEMLGNNQPIILQLIEITPALGALEGVKMELQDAAFPLLKDVIATDDLNIGFKDTDCAILVGARPRGPGMERKDLLNVNGMIFGPQGKAINDNASRNVKVLVVGNPANTNALIASSNAPDLKPEQFTAMTRLDHNRGLGLLAEKTNKHNTDIDKFIIWGNHSSTQFPDISQCTISGEPAIDILGNDWYKNTFIPKVQQRGAEIIKAKGSSSVASAVSAAINHMRDWVLGTPEGKWVSMAVPADGSYGISKDVFFSYPCICKNGTYEIVQGLELDAFTKEKLEETDKELREERSSIEDLL